MERQITNPQMKEKEELSENEMEVNNWSDK